MPTLPAIYNMLSRTIDVPTVPAIRVETTYSCSYCASSTFSGYLLLPIAPAVRIDTTYCLYKPHVLTLMARRNVQTYRMETQGAAERQATQDFNPGLFRLRQATRQPRSSCDSAPHGLPGSGLAIENLSGIQRGFQVCLL